MCDDVLSPVVSGSFNRYTMLMKIGLVFVFTLFVTTTGFGQVRPGVLLRVYPAGQVIAFQLALDSPAETEYRIYAGYNRTRRMNWGKHEDERGGGPGAGVEVIRFLTRTERDWFYGFRAEAWSLNIDWRQAGSSGSSRALVLQPLVVAGYRLTPGSVSADLSLSLGREINAHTSGEAVGEGMIILGGVSLTY